MDVVFRNICFMHDDIHRVQMFSMLLVGSLYFLGTSSQVEWRKVQKEGFGNRENGVASKSFSHWVLTSWKSFFVKEVCKWMFWWLRHLALAMTLLSRKENFFRINDHGASLKLNYFFHFSTLSLALTVLYLVKSVNYWGLSLFE